MTTEPQNDSLVEVALRVCDRWEADEVDDDALSNDIARLRVLAWAEYICGTCGHHWDVHRGDHAPTFCTEPGCDCGSWTRDA